MILLSSLIYSFFEDKSKKKSIICAVVSLGSILLLGLMSIFVHPMLESSARYKLSGELKITWNQADSEYYINHLGQPIRLRDACPEQVGDYISKDRIKDIPYVSVYEKTYISQWGLILSNEPKTHFVHGADARINQSIKVEIK